MIEIKNLKFKYNQDQTSYTLNDVSFHVKHGEWLSIVGHNGSGKSTTARLIGGLLVADSGQIIVDGQELTEETVWDIRDKIGMVFQNPDNQFVGATVEDDVAFGLENKGLPYKEMVSRVQEALSFVGMMDFKDREPARLSGGQKQRLCIARALLKKPKILILDDSTSAVDTATDAKIRTAFSKEIPNTTKIIIAQRISSVQDADKIIVLDDGKIDAIGTHDELKVNNAIYREVYESQVKGADDNE